VRVHQTFHGLARRFVAVFNAFIRVKDKAVIVCVFVVVRMCFFPEGGCMCVMKGCVCVMKVQMLLVFRVLVFITTSPISGLRCLPAVTPFFGVFCRSA